MDIRFIDTKVLKALRAHFASRDPEPLVPAAVAALTGLGEGVVKRSLARLHPKRIQGQTVDEEDYPVLVTGVV